MKTIRSAIVLIAAVTCIGLIVGCQNPPPTTVSVGTDQDNNITGGITSQVTSNISVGVQGEGNPSTGDWSAVVQVTFRDLPSAGAIVALQRAGGIPVTSRTWHLGSRSLLPESAMFQAIKIALGEGATIQGL